MSSKAIKKNGNVQESKLTVMRDTDADANAFGNMVALCLVFYVLQNVIVSYLDTGSVGDLTLLSTMGRSLETMFLLFAVELVLSFSVVILVKFAALRFISFALAYWLHFLALAVELAVPTYAVLAYTDVNTLPVPQATFVMVEMIIMAMKMHSYAYIRCNVLTRSEREQNDDKNKETKKIDRSCERVTCGNFFYFLAAPTLCYDLDYERSARINWRRVAWLLFAMFITFIVMYHLVSSAVMPTIVAHYEANFVELTLRLLLPVFVLYLLLFFFVFELVLNAAAELTRFADRTFYHEWWRSTVYSEFAVRWNVPINRFLRVHIFNRSLADSGSRTRATLLTFAISALAHELLLMVIFRMLAPPWCIILIGVQVGTIYAGRILRLKGTLLGNIIFWFGQVVGTSLLFILYARSYQYSLLTR
jgi:MBOAT, membrane-bound O-acyltransferase family